MKSSVVFFCTDCGDEYIRWQGQCSFCKSWNTLKEVVKDGDSGSNSDLLIKNIQDGYLDSEKSTIIEDVLHSSGFSEFDQVLGGGFINNQVVLLGGEPGIGKSTLCLQLAYSISKKDKVLYVSGEESKSQVQSRLSRIASENLKSNILFSNRTFVNEVIEFINKESPKVVIIDSLQTIYDKSVGGQLGSLAQQKSIISKLVSLAKSIDIAVLITTHINKDGQISGPKAVEHLVDTVLQFEGDRDQQLRLLRVLKNRFGDVGNLGVFNMTDRGLVVRNEGVFDGKPSLGSANTLITDGNRSFVVQIQALVVKTSFAYPKRVASGVGISRIQQLLAVSQKYMKTDLSSYDVYVKAIGGYKVSDVSADLAVIAAVYSSFKNKQIPGDVVFYGEVSLDGAIGGGGKAIENIKDRLGISEFYSGDNVSYLGQLEKTPIFV